MLCLCVGRTRTCARTPPFLELRAGPGRHPISYVGMHSTPPPPLSRVPARITLRHQRMKPAPPPSIPCNPSACVSVLHADSLSLRQKCGAGAGARAAPPAMNGGGIVHSAFARAHSHRAARHDQAPKPNRSPHHVKAATGLGARVARWSECVRVHARAHTHSHTVHMAHNTHTRTHISHHALWYSRRMSSTLVGSSVTGHVPCASTCAKRHG